MKKIKLISILFAILFFVAACGNSEESTVTNENSAGTEPEQVTENEKTAYPMTVSPTIAVSGDNEADAVTYEDVTFDSMPEKIVVFDYGFLDTLDALGVEGVVGVAKDTSLPTYLEKYKDEKYANVGSLKEPLLEDIAAIDPDVIFISGRQSAYYEELKEIAPVLFVGTSQEDYWNSFLSSVDIAAKMFGKEIEAKAYIAKIDEAINEVNALAEYFDTALTTLYNGGKLMGFGTNSRFGYVYDVYGFKQVADDIEASNHGSNFGFEAILKYDPQVLFVIDRSAAVGEESNIQVDMENEIIKKTQAYQNNRIIYLDGPLWYLSGGGLQSELAKIEEIIAELK